jgi:hypothetical protein
MKARVSLQKARSAQSHREKSVGNSALQEFSEGIAQRNYFSEVVGGEVGSGSPGAGAFAADLYYADDAIAGENRSAHDFLDHFGAFRGEFCAFKNACVLHRREIVDNLRPVLAGSARGERGFARTERFLAMRAATDVKENRAASPVSPSKASARRSSSVARFMLCSETAPLDAARREVPAELMNAG